MARASFWMGDEHPVKDMVFELLGSYPHDLDDYEDMFKNAGAFEGADIAFLGALDELYGVEVPDDVVEDLYAGAPFGELCEVLDNLPKVAQVTSMIDRARGSVYRSSHREEIKRKSKKRRKLQAKGLRPKMRRIGTSTSGFTYVMDTKGSEGGGHANVSGLNRSFDFRPDKPAAREEHSTLRWR